MLVGVGQAQSDLAPPGSAAAVPPSPGRPSASTTAGSRCSRCPASRTSPPWSGPGPPSAAEASYARAGSAAIANAARTTTCGWVVDVRGNASEDLGTLLGAVAALLPAGNVLQRVDREGHRDDVVLGDDAVCAPAGGCSCRSTRSTARRPAGHGPARPRHAVAGEGSSSPSGDGRRAERRRGVVRTRWTRRCTGSPTGRRSRRALAAGRPRRDRRDRAGAPRRGRHRRRARRRALGRRVPLRALSVPDRSRTSRHDRSSIERNRDPPATRRWQDASTGRPERRSQREETACPVVPCPSPSRSPRPSASPPAVQLARHRLRVGGGAGSSSSTTSGSTPSTSATVDPRSRQAAGVDQVRRRHQGRHRRDVRAQRVPSPRTARPCRAWTSTCSTPSPPLRGQGRVHPAQFRHDHPRRDEQEVRRRHLELLHHGRAQEAGRHGQLLHRGTQWVTQAGNPKQVKRTTRAG